MNKTFEANPRGSALFFGLLLVSVLASLTLLFSSAMIANSGREESDVAGARALHLAEAYIEMKVQQSWAAYTPVRTDLRVATAYANLASDSVWTPFGEALVKCVETAPDYTAGADHIDIHYTAMAVARSGIGVSAGGSRTVPRQVERVVRFGLGQAEVFDYVYFANNFGWMYGSTLYLYGNMGANGDLNFSGPPKVDGNLFAAKNPQIGAQGVINGAALHDTIPQYQTLAAHNPLLAPTNPAAGAPFPAGYSGQQVAATQQAPLDMPFLGDLSLYKDLASAAVIAPRPDLGEPNGRTGGIVKQLKAPGLDPTDPTNYNILVNQTYGFDSSQIGAYAKPTLDSHGAIASVSMVRFTSRVDPGVQANNGNLALIGTPAQPLVVLGPVVISNDLAIKGTLTGQGTFYTGRNVHVVGDVTYANPPGWTQNDTNVNATAAANKGKDGVGFGAKGNIVLGDYTQATLSGGNGSDYWDYALMYISPGFTNPYPVDSTDANLGYVSYTQNGQPWFNGDYTAKDGGQKYNASLSGGVQRRFFESSFSNAYIQSIAAKPTNVQGIFYCNHYYGGRTSNYTLYGADIMRDEAIVTDSAANFYYDPRVAGAALNSYINLFLPRSSNYSTLLVHEITGAVLPQFKDAPKVLN